MSASRPFFSFFLPMTPGSRTRSLAHRYKGILFGLSVGSILATQVYTRPELVDEAPGTYDRIHRRAYMTLPDGRQALVYPIVYTDLSFYGLYKNLCESLNPLP